MHLTAQSTVVATLVVCLGAEFPAFATGRTALAVCQRSCWCCQPSSTVHVYVCGVNWPLLFVCMLCYMTSFGPQGLLWACHW